MARAKPIKGIDPKAPIRDNAARMIVKRLDEMLDWESYLYQPDRVYELHQLRIAAKRLRYTLDIFQSVYVSQTTWGKEYTDFLEQLRGLQDRLGVIHDADVLLPQLLEQLAQLLKAGYGASSKGEPVLGVHSVDLEASKGLLTLCREAQSVRDRSFQRLTEDWNQLLAHRTFTRLRELLLDPELASGEYEPQENNEQQISVQGTGLQENIYGEKSESGDANQQPPRTKNSRSSRKPRRTADAQNGL